MNKKHSPKPSDFKPSDFIYPSVFVLLIGFIFLLQQNDLFSVCHGVIPRETRGLLGVITAPFFHSGLEHLSSNAFPLWVLSFFTFYFYRGLAFYVIVMGALLTGTGVWFLGDFGRFSDGFSHCHIGASGVVYMLAAFIFVSGLIRKNRALMAVSLVVTFLYGGLVWGIFPEEILHYKLGQERISWESHLAGAVVGISFAFMLRKYQSDRFQTRKIVPTPEYDQWLWEEYQNQYPDAKDHREIEKGDKKNLKDLL